MSRTNKSEEIVNFSTTACDSVGSRQDSCPRTELDSHANMVVAGKNALVIEDTGKTVEVKPFSSECNTLDNVSIVDAMVKHQDPHSERSHFNLMRIALHVPTMESNLVPPFAIREEGVQFE